MGRVTGVPFCLVPGIKSKSRWLKIVDLPWEIVSKQPVVRGIQAETMDQGHCRKTSAGTHSSAAFLSSLSSLSCTQVKGLEMANPPSPSAALRWVRPGKPAGQAPPFPGTASSSLQTEAEEVAERD